MACSRPPAIGNGHVVETPPYDNHVNLTYQCDIGYSLDNIEPGVKCTDGEWTGDLPRCIFKLSKNPTVVEILLWVFVGIGCILVFIFIAAILFIFCNRYKSHKKSKVPITPPPRPTSASPIALRGTGAIQGKRTERTWALGYVRNVPVVVHPHKQKSDLNNGHTGLKEQSEVPPQYDGSSERTESSILSQNPRILQAYGNEQIYENTNERKVIMINNGRQIHTSDQQHGMSPNNHGTNINGLQVLTPPPSSGFVQSGSSFPRGREVQTAPGIIPVSELTPSQRNILMTDVHKLRKEKLQVKKQEKAWRPHSHGSRDDVYHEASITK